jgi:hypothetical protein
MMCTATLLSKKKYAVQGCGSGPDPVQSALKGLDPGAKKEENEMKKNNNFHLSEN